MLKVLESDGATHLTGTVFGAGDFAGRLVPCGQDGSKKCLQINSSPGTKIDGAFMFYSNAEVDLELQKVSGLSPRSQIT